MQSLLELDRKRYSDGKMPLWQIFWRKSQIAQNKLLRFFYHGVAGILKKQDGIQISREVEWGPGAYFGHPYAITVNNGAKLGKNINIHKGATIGRENRGPRRGVPTIGNDVWIGINAILVGKITVGDDVLIAANSFVNQDVPSHSVVIGNPCVIHPRKNATEGYINNRV